MMEPNGGAPLDGGNEYKRVRAFFPRPKPLLRLIQTESGHHVYDAGTNKLFSCSPEVFSLLNRLLNEPYDHAVKGYADFYGEIALQNGLAEIAGAMDAEGVFQLSRAEGFGQAEHSQLRELLEGSVRSVLL